MKSVVIEEDVTEIPDYAFYTYGFLCANMTSVQIPETVKRIGNNAFSATGLTAVTIPDSVKEIGRGAFYNCSALKTCKLSVGRTGDGFQLSF